MLGLRICWGVMFLGSVAVFVLQKGTNKIQFNLITYTDLTYLISLMLTCIFQLFLLKKVICSLFVKNEIVIPKSAKSSVVKPVKVQKLKKSNAHLISQPLLADEFLKTEISDLKVEHTKKEHSSEKIPEIKHEPIENNNNKSSFHNQTEFAINESKISTINRSTINNKENSIKIRIAGTEDFVQEDEKHIVFLRGKLNMKIEIFN